jgi:hypothetical protein
MVEAVTPSRIGDRACAGSATGPSYATNNPTRKRMGHLGTAAFAVIAFIIVLVFVPRVPRAARGDQIGHVFIVLTLGVVSAILLTAIVFGAVLICYMTAETLSFPALCNILDGLPREWPIGVFVAAYLALIINGIRQARHP